MTSSGPVPYWVGGFGSSSSSSSSLSPLAPPFQVDRPLQKHNSTNMYGNYFDSAAHLWNHASSSVNASTFAPTQLTGINDACSSSPAIYGYSGSQPNPAVQTVAYDPFTYGPFPNSTSSTSEQPVKPYYSSYVSPPLQKDGFLSLGVSSGDCYDLLSNSASSHLTGFGDGDPKREWSGLWSGMSEESKWAEYGLGFPSKDSNLSDSLSSKSPFLVDQSSKSQYSTDVHTHPFVEGRNPTNPKQGLALTSPVSDGCFDILGGAFHLESLGIQQDSRPLLDCSRISTFSSSPIPKNVSHLQSKVVESVTNFCDSEKDMTLEDFLSRCGVTSSSCTQTASTFPITKNKLPNGQISSPAEGVFSAPKPSPEVSVVAKASNTSAGCDFSYPVEPRMPLGLKRHSNIIIRKPPSSSVMPASSQIGETLNSKVGSEKTQVSTEMTHQFSSGGLDLEADDAQATYAVDKLSGVTDVYNPAEDSPCWRGASSSYFSPSGLSEGLILDVANKKLDECKSLSNQPPQNKSFLAEASDTGDSCSGKGKEGTLKEKPLDKEKYSTTRQPLCFDLNTGDGLQFADESYDPEGSGKCPPVVAKDSLDVPLSSENNHEISTLGDSASLEHYQGTSNLSNSMIDINMLLKTLSTLSEILRCHCFSKRASVPEQHSIVIKHIIANLNASMSLMAEKMSTIPSSEVISFKKELPVAQMVNDAAFGAAAAAAAAEVEGTSEGILDSAACKDDPNTIPHVDLTEAIKNILHENFLGEEMDQQKLLYKSLWLDAEASLCAMTAKARFLRVKAEVERTYDCAKDKQRSSSYNISRDVLEKNELASHCKDSSVQIECQKSCAASQNDHAEVSVDVSSMDFERPKVTEEEIHLLSSHASMRGCHVNGLVASGSNSFVNDAGSSVMARYQILKSRIESSEAPRQTLKCRVDHSSLNNGCNTSSDQYNYLPGRDSSSPIYQTLECTAEKSDSVHKDREFQNFQCRSKSIGDLEDGEASVMARFHIIKNRIQQSDSVDPLKVVEDDLEELGLLEKDRVFQNFQGLSKSIGDLEEGEASMMARFRIIQDRFQKSNSVDPLKVVAVLAEDSDELGLSEKQGSTVRGAFGPYPIFTEDENVDQMGFPGLQETYLTQLSQTDRQNSEVFQSWYENDCSSSDWEHVSKEDLRKTN